MVVSVYNSSRIMASTSTRACAPVNDPNNPSGSRTWYQYIAYSWASLWRTIKLARRLKDIVLFLAAWFLLSDAIATVSGTAVLYAKTQLHMAPSLLGLINVIATTAGVLGAFTWAFISRTFGLKPHQTILACICIFEIIPFCKVYLVTWISSNAGV